MALAAGDTKLETSSGVRDRQVVERKDRCVYGRYNLSTSSVYFRVILTTDVAYRHGTRVYYFVFEKINDSANG